jgi:hypothetical protein
MSEQTVFVIGSNDAGRHAESAAESARRFHGAVLGRGEGAQDSAYAIPTKDAWLCKAEEARV